MLTKHLENDMYHGKKFIASYSGGKDSVLAIHRAIKLGMTPVSLLTTYHIERERSWFHGIPKDLLNSVSNALEIPIYLIETKGAEYDVNFEKALKVFKDQGIEFCVFGDIDLSAHREWCESRCQSVGMEAIFPLWQENRRALVEEFIESGYTANITVLNTTQLSAKHLGLALSKETIASIEHEGADACGENGEYHTFVSAGPLFKKPVYFCFGNKVEQSPYAILPVEMCKF